MPMGTFLSGAGQGGAGQGGAGKGGAGQGGEGGHNVLSSKLSSAADAIREIGSQLRLVG